MRRDYMISDQERIRGFWILGVMVCAVVGYTNYNTHTANTQHSLDQTEINDISHSIEVLGHRLDEKDNERAQQNAVDAARRKREQVKKDRLAFLQNEVKCLADNVYAEAGFEPEAGQLAVATVTMNRVANKYYPKTVCDVVYERHMARETGKIVCQFSWTCKPRHGFNTAHYRAILQMARAVYFKHERSELCSNALLYHAVYINTPGWASNDNLVATIGQHLFYKQ